MRSLKISFVFVFDILLLIFGICRVYENMQQLSYGNYVNAVEITENGIRILDFNITKEQLYRFW
ncbi:MAG: hypothetical protein KBS52_04270 [Clostridiales bacterium]|nr:hypothetical protein [Candidatus Equinaster intestinalis]